jgi:formylglycine-generating enzyme required for sulfatase activity
MKLWTFLACWLAVVPAMQGQQVMVQPESKGLIEYRTTHAGSLRTDGADGKTWYYTPFKQTALPRFVVNVPPYLQPKLELPDAVWFDPLSALGGPAGERGGRGVFMRQDVGTPSATNPQVLPASLRFYVDTALLSVNYNGNLWTEQLPDAAIQSYFRPFYFRKYEVTNAEYREFVTAVQDSIMRVRLGYVKADGTLDRDVKIDLSDTAVRNKTKMFLPPGERFYAYPEIDTRQLLYAYTNPNRQGQTYITHVYPDTVCWMNDFTYSSNEPMTNMYNWHPAYDHYPVVGVSYYQACAYLHWRTQELNKAWKKKGERGTLRCELPSEREWDMVTTVIKKENKWWYFSDNYNNYADNSWNTDLLVRYDASKSPPIYNAKDEEPKGNVVNAERKLLFNWGGYWNPLREKLLDHHTTPGNYVEQDGAFHTSPVCFNEKGVTLDGKVIQGKKYGKEEVPFYTKLHRDPYTGIYNLDGNVSEWMRDEVSAWKKIFAKHQEPRESPDARERLLVWQVERYYAEQLPAEGRLVRGGNWYDERYSCIGGRNVAGIQCKTYLQEEDQHCTVGFRYVVWVDN